MKIFALSIAMCGVARADALVDEWRPEIAFGMRIGTLPVNSRENQSPILGHLDLGVRQDRWLLYADYTIGRPRIFGDAVAARGERASTESVGLFHHVGANVRRVIGRKFGDETAVDVYVDGGLGLQQLRWDDGGTWTRPDVSFEIGVSMIKYDRGIHGGPSLGFRVQIAPRNDVSKNDPAICAGPCDTPTRPTQVDTSFMFALTVHVGR